MNTRWMCAAMLVALGSSDSVEASYVIKLKNGNEYVTTRYWSEGKQLLFDTYGGVFGVEQTFVAEIEKSFRLGLAKAEDSSVTVPKQSVSATPKNLAVGTPTPESNPEIKPSLKDPIGSEFNQLRVKAKEVDGLLTSEIAELLKEITAFRNKISKDSKLFIAYGREFNEAQEIGAAVEMALRSRTQ